MFRGPMLVVPRLDEKPWGGRRLAEFGFDLPSTAPIGEAVVTHAEAMISTGPYSGRALADVIAMDPLQLLGVEGVRLANRTTTFPLLVKWIDAPTHLSIQVHPNNDNAPADSLGKTEAWFVLDAAPDAELFIGLQDPDDFSGLAADARAGRSISGRMRRIPARPGEVVFLPAGTIHALGAGVMVYEIQQPSTITYRFDDWGRLDEHGQSRELHIEESLAVADPSLRPEATAPPTRRPGQPPQPCVQCDAFTLELIALDAGEAITVPAEENASVLSCVQGAVQVSGEDEAVRLPTGETAVLLAQAGPITVTARVSSRLLRGWISAP